MGTDSPLHFSIYSDIRRQLMDGRLKPGDILPKESELEKKYGVSRAPIRQAMGRLEMEAFIVRMQGKGTFVTDRGEQIRWLLFGGFRKFYEHHFDEVNCRTLLVETSSPDETARRALDLEEGRKTIHIHRVRSWLDTPLFSIHTYLPDTMNINAFKKAGNFFNITDVLKNYFSITLKSAEESIIAVLSKTDTAETLKIPSGSPLLQIERINYDTSGNIIHFSRYFGRSDICPHTSSYGVEGTPEGLYASSSFHTQKTCTKE